MITLWNMCVFGERLRLLRAIASAAPCLLLLASVASAGVLQQVTVFQQGLDGYHTYRGCSIVQANDGTLLAFSTGHVNDSSDYGNVDLVLKRSFDGGKTWGPLQVVYDNGTKEAGGAAPVVDQATGNIILPFVLETNKPMLKISTNNGATWSALTDLTSTAKLSTWNGYSLGVHGIQLERGEHVGRLIVTGNHTLLNQNLHPAGRESHMIYSDDGGFTWQVGGVLKNSSGDINPNESTIVELVDGSVYMSSRNQGGLEKRRLKGYSHDSGESFVDPAQVEYQLIDPVVHASLLRYAATDQGDAINRILFSNPAHETTRVRMTIKSSFDETVTWNSGKLVYRGLSGYSDMVKLSSGGGGILYENGTSAYYNKISFARFDTAWLDSPALMRVDFRDYNAKDQEGNGLTGTFDASQAFVAGDSRYSSGIALHCDGNDAVRYADSANHLFDFDASDSFTLETVFRTSSHINFGPNGAGGLIAKDATSGPYYWLRVESGKLRFGAFDGSSTSGIISNENVSDGQWHHAALVFDRAASQIRLYVDYQLDSSASITLTGSLANSSDLLLGAFNTGTFPLNLVGDLDLARISMGALQLRDFVQPTGLAGDANGDGLVNLADLQILGDNWGSSDAYWLVGDFTGDGVVNLADLQVLGDHWGSGVSADMTFARALDTVGIQVPEPTGAMLIGISALLLCYQRR